MTHIVSLIENVFLLNMYRSHVDKIRQIYIEYISPFSIKTKINLQR